MFSAAIFDMDGLLIDSERAIMKAWIAATARVGKPLTEAQFVAVVGSDARTSGQILSELLGQQAFEQVRAMVREELMATEPSQMFPVKPGALEVLLRLREIGVPCAVASSTVTQEVRRRLSSVKLLDFFPIVIGGDMAERGKPDPALYHLASSQLNTAAERCLAFEDSGHGVAAAHAAHVPVVLVPDIVKPAAVTLERSYHVLPSLADAEPLLAQWFPGS